jgi:primase-polymerase (primpol)-like protein
MGIPPTAAALPETLVDRDQWICWRSQNRDGKPTKAPIIPGTTRFASTTDPDTWRSFATAREAVTTTSVAGLGFVFTADDPLVGIDLDDCRDPTTGDPTSWASRIIGELDSYTEVSPSGTGYHILVSGTLPEGRNRAGDLELYDRSRFFTVTGDHVSGTPTTVAARTDALETLHATEVADATEDAATPSAGKGTERTAVDTSSDEGTGATEAAALSDEELLSRAKHAANGEKFTRLWNGTTSGYESHSEADMALCRLLAFWTGCDAGRIDRLFRRSDLSREKWDEIHYADGSTYGEKTIDRAITHTNDVYTPPETESVDQSPTATATSAGSTDQSLGPGETTHEAAPAGTATEAESTPASDPSTETADSASNEMPAPGHPRRAQARRERIEELVDRVEALLAENERLHTELQTERERRQELEDAIEEERETGSWWPLWRR